VAAPAPRLEEQRAERQAQIRDASKPSYRVETVTGADADRPEEALHPEREHDGYGDAFGTALHALLEQCVRGRLDGASLSTDVVRAGLRQAGAETDPESVRRARTMVERFLEGRIWTELQHAESVYTEYPIALERRAESGPVVRRGVIDLAYRTEEGWVLIDYKSDRVHDSPGEVLADGHSYIQQIRAYAESWTEVIGASVHRAGLWFADSGTHVVVIGPGDTR
jgi:ATP-dependent helicase/nuclease subunit A